MKKLLTSFFLVAILFSAHAQPTITSISLMDAGFTTRSHALTDMYFIPGSAGANVNWDFSSFPTNSFFSSTVLDIASTANGAQFTSATLGSENSDGSGGYFTTANGKLAFVGLIAASGATIDDYDPDPREILVTPITYQDMFNETFDGTHDNTVSGFMYDRGGTITIEADAYGTVVLPSVTVPNALRVHVRIEYDDKLSGTTVASYIEDRYEWYHQSHRGPFVSLVEFQFVGNPTTTRFGSYQEITAIGLAENDQESGLKIYPNPANGNVFIENSQNNRYRDIQIVDLKGQLMQEVDLTTLPANQRVNVDVSDLPAGIYFVNAINVSGERENHKLIVN